MIKCAISNCLNNTKSFLNRLEFCISFNLIFQSHERQLKEYLGFYDKQKKQEPSLYLDDYFLFLNSKDRQVICQDSISNHSCLNK